MLFNARNIRFERSQYPIVSDGSEYQAHARFDDKLSEIGTLKSDGTFTTSLGSWSYLVIDFSCAREVKGAIKEIEDINVYNERAFENRMAE